MSLTITTQVLQNSSRKVILKIFITGNSDDTGVIYDASSYFGGNKNVRIMEIKYSLNGFSAELDWDGTANTNILSLATDTIHDLNEIKYTDFGGINNKNVENKTGDIKITTKNISSGDNGFIILYLKPNIPQRAMTVYLVDGFGNYIVDGFGNYIVGVV